MNTEDISFVDKNFAAEEIIYRGIVFYNIQQEENFQIYGLYQPRQNGVFKRMPDHIAQGINPAVARLYTNTSGGRIRFRTNSTKILLRSILSKITNHVHMPKTGVTYFDLYADGAYQGPFQHGKLEGMEASQLKAENVYDSCLTLEKKKMREILINFPLYNNVDAVYIGLDEDAQVEKAPAYTHGKPIVFYGPSITQGACASHPGNCYANMLSRHFDADIINLGFSSGAKGEDAMADYLASLEMGILVLDYDHNAPDPEHLAQTHQRMFQHIRAAQPELPIVLVSAADIFHSNQAERRAVILKTYQDALAAGDQHVYFVDGDDIFAPAGVDFCTVDSLHPNDLGFYLMYRSVAKVIEKIW